jgi:hypothetical protein
MLGTVVKYCYIKMEILLKKHNITKMYKIAVSIQKQIS